MYTLETAGKLERGVCLILFLSSQLPGTANPLCQCCVQLLYSEITQQQQQKSKNNSNNFPISKRILGECVRRSLFIWLSRRKVKTWNEKLVRSGLHSRMIGAIITKQRTTSCHIVFSLSLQLRLLPDEGNNSMVFFILLFFTATSSFQFFVVLF